MTDSFSTPDDFGDIRQSDLQGSLGGRLGAQALDALDPQDSLSGAYIYRRMREESAGGRDIGVPGAGSDVDIFSSQPLEDRQAASDAFQNVVSDTAIADAKARVKQEGLEGLLKLPDQPSIKSPVLDLMIDEAHERRDREIAIAKGPPGFMPGALGLVTSLGAGMIDPINMAAFSIPVLGEARMGKLLASAGDSILARTGARALQGGLQGAAGTALLQPADWWLHTQDGQDYTMADAFKSVVMGAGMGAGFHAAGGLFGDVRARIKGAPLPGSPEDLLARGLMTGTHVHADQLAEEGVPIGEVPGIVPPQTPAPFPGDDVLLERYGHSPADIREMTPDERADAVDKAKRTFEAYDVARAALIGDRAPVHPAEVLADLPPAAQEDAFRATVADVAADRPSRGAEMLEIAADHDPRIAESFDAFHGSPHDFDRFDASKIGTGEGAQAYGHGLYFAEDSRVAESYVPLTAGDSGDAIPESQREGNLYKVRINANLEHLLDWDKQLNEQTPHVQQALRTAMGEQRWKEFQNADASTAVRNGFIAFHDESVAAKLRDAGIPGIKYLDQGSRAPVGFRTQTELLPGDNLYHVIDAANVTRGTFKTREEAAAFADKKNQEGQTRNFVMFDDKHIEITHKNGEAVGLDQFKASPEAKAQAAPAVETGAHIPDLVEKPKPRGRGAAHPDTLSLNEHLASQGGLKPDPELESIYGNKRGPFVSGFGPLIRKSGMSLDEALSSAKQHGYMSDPHDAENGNAGSGGRTSHGLTPNDLLDKLDAENRGQKLYKAGHVEATKYDPEQEKHVIMGNLEQQLEAAGEKISAIDPKLLNRTVEIVHREGVSDVMDAYERAIMEDAERYNAIADAARSDPRLADLPGFDDGRAAPGDGGGNPGLDRQAGGPDQGARPTDDSQPSSHGARAAAAANDPRWRELADVRPAEEDPEVLAQSREADHLAEPDSLKPESSLTALEKQAADAEAIWRKMEPTLTEKERALVNDVLDQLKLDKEARDKIITDGAACLAAAVA